MKRWLFFLLGLLLVAALGGMPFSGNDVARLKPVEVVQVTSDGDMLVVKTDTGDYGVGSTLDHAFSDMNRTASGLIFLETAEYVLLNPSAARFIPELTSYLRSGCGVCFVVGDADLQATARFFDVKPPQVTLQDCRAEGAVPQMLYVLEGRMQFAGA